MPVEDSRLSGFYKLSVARKRREKVAQLSSLTAEEIEALASHGELGEVVQIE